MNQAQKDRLKTINRAITAQREKLMALQAEIKGTEEGERISGEIDELVTVSVELADIAGGE